MSVYVYGITHSAVDLSDAKGLRDSDVYSVAMGTLAALCSEIKESTLLPGEEDLWAHERVLEEAQKHGAVLPARFGTVLADDDSVAASLQEKRQAFEERLEDLEGKVEIGIRAFRLSDGDTPTPDPTDGHAYMMQKLDEQKRSDRDREFAAGIWNALHEELDGSYTNHKLRLAPSPSVAFSAAYLVEHQEIDRFTRIVADHQEVPADIELFVTGPWPPYSFAEGDES
jgi:hypothetical protein